MTVMHAAPPPPTADAPRLDAARGQRSGVAERLTLILEVFTTGPDSLLLDDITDTTGLPRSTVFRLLGQMIDLGWLERDCVGYRLGPRAVAMGSRTRDHSPLRAAAAGVLNNLQLRTGGVVHLSVLEGGTVVYLDKVGGAALASVPSRVGARVPASSTVSGRALLATLAPEEVDLVLRAHLERTGDGPTATRLHAHLNGVRRHNGVAVTRADQCTARISSAAAPIVGPRGAAGAISLALSCGRPPESVAPALSVAVRQVSRALFPGWTPGRAAQGR
jgi:DNA-binding IclR family transcriptional regulator